MKKVDLPLMVIAILCAVCLLNSSFDIFDSGEYIHKTGKKSQGISALVIAVGFFAVGAYAIVFIIFRIAKWWKHPNKKKQSKTNE